MVINWERRETVACETNYEDSWFFAHLGSICGDRYVIGITWEYIHVQLFHFKILCAKFEFSLFWDSQCHDSNFLLLRGICRLFQIWIVPSLLKRYSQLGKQNLTTASSINQLTDNVYLLTSKCWSGHWVRHAVCPIFVSVRHVCLT